MCVGIDTSFANIALARTRASGKRSFYFVADATSPALCESVFDLVICIQNGISAFGVDPTRLLTQSLRVTRPDGAVLLSSYADAFWTDRLEWFRLQADEGLIGKIDDQRTGNGTIVCVDGFESRTFTPADFQRIADGLGVCPKFKEIDESSVFCELQRSA